MSRQISVEFSLNLRHHGQLMSANTRLCKLKIQKAHCFYSLSFKLMHWHVFSPYLNLPLKTRIIFTSLKKSENKPLSGMISETTAVMEGHRRTSLKFIFFRAAREFFCTKVSQSLHPVSISAASWDVMKQSPNSVTFYVTSQKMDTNS